MPRSVPPPYLRAKEKANTVVVYCAKDETKVKIIYYFLAITRGVGVVDGSSISCTKSSTM